MVERVILHVGLEKTGSSSIQAWLHENRDVLLANHGILYPKSYIHFKYAHHGLNPIFRRNSPLDLEIIFRSIMQEARSAETIILSNECWVRHELEVSRLRAFLQYFDAKYVQIICYVREHLEYTQSVWRERIHLEDQFVRQFSEFAATAKEELNCRISNIIQIMEAVGHLDLRWYNKCSLKNGNIVEDFCTLVGISGMNYEIEDKNPSLGGNLLLYKFARNQYYFDNNLETKNINKYYHDLKIAATLKKKCNYSGP